MIFKKPQLIRYVKIFFVVLLIYAVLLISLFFSGEIADGVRDGIYLSVNHIFPSLFVFMVLSGFMMSSKASSYISIPFWPLGKYVFGLSKNEMSIFILSLLGGFPVGARLISDSVSRGETDYNKGSLMLAFCVNCGPAFLITFVGAGIFTNKLTGLLLFLSEAMAAFFIALLCSPKLKKYKSPISKSDAKVNNATVNIIDTVYASFRSLCLVCVLITAFCGLLPVMTSLIRLSSVEASLLIKGLLEVTSGTRSVLAFENFNPVLLATVFTSFGGGCVFLQIAALIKKSKLKLRYFFLMRIPFAALSTINMFLLLKLFPQSTDCFSYSAQNNLSFFTVSPAASIFLILLCIMLLFFRKKTDKMNT